MDKAHLLKPQTHLPTRMSKTDGDTSGPTRRSRLYRVEWKEARETATHANHGEQRAERRREESEERRWTESHVMRGGGAGHQINQEVGSSYKR